MNYYVEAGYVEAGYFEAFIPLNLSSAFTRAIEEHSAFLHRPVCSSVLTKTFYAESRLDK